MDATRVEQQSKNNSTENNQRRNPNSLVISSEDVDNVLKDKCKKRPKQEDLLDEINFFKATDSFRLHANEESNGYRNAEKQKQKELQDSYTIKSENAFKTMPLIIQELRKLLCFLKDNNELKLNKFTRNLNSNADYTIDGVNNEKKDKTTKVKQIIYNFRVKIKLVNSTNSSSHKNVEKNDEKRNDQKEKEKMIENMQLIIQQLEELSSIILENDEKGELNNNEVQNLQNEFSVNNLINKFVGDFLVEVNNLNTTDSSPLPVIGESGESQNTQTQKLKGLEDCQNETNQSDKAIKKMKLTIRKLMEQNDQLSKEIPNVQQKNCSQQSGISGLRQGKEGEFCWFEESLFLLLQQQKKI